MINHKNNTKWYTQIVEFKATKGTNQKGNVKLDSQRNYVKVADTNIDVPLKICSLAACGQTSGIL